MKEELTKEKKRKTLYVKLCLCMPQRHTVECRHNSTHSFKLAGRWRKEPTSGPCQFTPGKRATIRMEWEENKQVQRRISLSAIGEEEGEAAELGRRQKHKTTRNWIGRWKRKKEDTTREKGRIKEEEKKDAESGINKNSGRKRRQIAKKKD